MYRRAVVEHKSQGVVRSAFDDTDPATKQEAVKLKLNCCNNLAACHFQVSGRTTKISLTITTEPNLLFSGTTTPVWWS